MILFNGQMSENTLAHDRGLHYGDGVFTTISVFNAQPLAWSYHWDRLQHDCQILGLNIPSQALLQQEMATLLSQMHAQRCVLKIILTRQTTVRGYKPDPQAGTNRLLLIYPWSDDPTDYFKTGLRVITSSWALSSQPALAGVKHLNRLEHVLARGAWQDPQIQEAILCDQQGHLVEAIQANLFVIFQETLYTPVLTHAGVAGVMRRIILENAQKWQIKVQEDRLPLSWRDKIDAAFLCNSIIGVRPIGQWDDRMLKMSEITQRVACHIKSEPIVI